MTTVYCLYSMIWKGAASCWQAFSFTTVHLISKAIAQLHMKSTPKLCTIQNKVLLNNVAEI